MNIKPKYVPILKWKQGEQSALKELDNSTKDYIIPLIEITPGFNEDKLDKTLNSWKNRAFYFDVHNNCYEEDEYIYFRILKKLDSNYVIPVLSIDDDISIIQKAKKFSKLGFALRIATNDIDDDFEDILESITKNFSPSEIDLILDAKAISEENSKEKLSVLKSILEDIPKVSTFRNVILSSSAFPSTLSKLEKFQCHHLERFDWKFWKKASLKLNSKYNINIIYSDYCIDSPNFFNYIPGMSPSFNIRYTSNNEFIVLKGVTIKKGGLDIENVSALCSQLTNLGDFCGKDFSWGDNYIYERSHDYDGNSCGNLSTWRKIGTNHHITFILNQLSNPS